MAEFVDFNGVVPLIDLTPNQHISQYFHRMPQMFTNVRYLGIYNFCTSYYNYFILYFSKFFYSFGLVPKPAVGIIFAFREELRYGKE